MSIFNEVKFLGRRSNIKVEKLTDEEKKILAKNMDKICDSCPQAYELRKSMEFKTLTGKEAVDFVNKRSNINGCNPAVEGKGLKVLVATTNNGKKLITFFVYYPNDYDMCEHAIDIRTNNDSADYLFLLMQYKLGINWSIPNKYLKP